MRHESLRKDPYRESCSWDQARRMDAETRAYRLWDVQAGYYFKVSTFPQLWTIWATHIVKQSNMNATATGLIVVATSSGIGGASLRLPSL